MINDKMPIKGTVTLVLYNELGVIKEKHTHSNLVVSTGLNLFASRLLSNSDAVPSHMAIGSGTTPVMTGDIALETEITRTALTSAVAVNNEITFIGTYAAGVGTGAITEAGILNSNSGGTLLNRVTFGSVNKAALDSMVITWTLTIG